MNTTLPIYDYLTPEDLDIMGISAKEYRTMVAKTTGAKKTKYKAVRTKVIVDGKVVTFHSKGELNRYNYLCMLQLGNAIKDLKCQVRYPLYSKSGDKIASYVADFTYINALGNFVVEDFKGFVTATYKLKRKWMLADYGINIHESTEHNSPVG